MREYVKKRNLKHDLVESSSSAVTAPLRPPKDVLDLGVHLIHELGLERSTDTLGRWMAHDLAERMEMSKNAATPSERIIVRDQCVELILKLWDRRRVLPGSVDPLESYKDVLSVVKELTLETNLWTKPKGSRRQILLGELRRDVNRLVRLLLIEKDVREKNRPEPPTIVVNFLPKEEQEALAGINNLLGKRTPKNTPENLLDAIAKSLAELRQLLSSDNVARPLTRRRKASGTTTKKKVATTHNNKLTHHAVKNRKRH